MKEIILEHLSSLDPSLYVLLLAILPIFEARYAMIAAFALNASVGGMPWQEAFVISVIGNILIIIPVLLMLPWINKVMHKWEFTSKIMDYFLRRARKRKDLIDKYGFWGLTVFVAIPLPVTGAWTGSLMAFLFDIKFKKAILAIIVGVLIATSVMTIASYGGFSFLSFLLKL
ncbi:MAG: small multi-drug export protein [Pseudomonadota bacterium]